MVKYIPASLVVSMENQISKLREVKPDANGLVKGSSEVDAKQVDRYNKMKFDYLLHLHYISWLLSYYLYYSFFISNRYMFTNYLMVLRNDKEKPGRRTSDISLRTSKFAVVEHDIFEKFFWHKEV
jgi:hypothetical protein